MAEVGRRADLPVIALARLPLIEIQQLLGGISKELFTPFDREVVALIFFGTLALFRLRDTTWPGLVIVQ